MEIGVCGEHGGDLNSVKFFCRAGMDYVSASPLRVPIARLAAAQAEAEASKVKAGVKKPAKAAAKNSKPFEKAKAKTGKKPAK